MKAVQHHVQIPDRPERKSLEGVSKLGPGTTVSHPGGKTWTVGPKGGTYFSDAASKQLDKNQDGDNWWEGAVWKQVNLYNKQVDENNAKAKEGMVSEEPKSGWKVWEWAMKAKSR